MRSVCYIVEMVVLQQGQDPKPEHKLFFGPVNEVLEELKDAAKNLAQAKLVHANEPETLVVLMNRESVIDHLINQDLNKLPRFPMVGTGQSQARFRECPTIAFINEIKLSIRGETDKDEKVTTPIHILLPPGVRL